MRSLPCIARLVKQFCVVYHAITRMVEPSVAETTPTRPLSGVVTTVLGMEYRKLGGTGLEVSRICLGCMSYGDPARGNHAWTLPEDESRPMIRRAVEAGITFFDTSNSYSDGSSEEIVGRALNEYARRDEIVIATKVFFSGRTTPNAAGLSRKAIMTEIDGSLRRLGTDYVDLYQIHRWTRARRSRRPWRRCMTWSRPGRPDTSARRRCTRGSSPRRCSRRTCTAGPGSSRCRTTTTCSTARRSGRCTGCAPIRASR